MRLTYISILTVLTGLMFLLSSCGSHRTGVSSMQELTPSPLPGNPVAALAASAPTWTDMTAPVRMELSQPMRLTASGTAKMINSESVSVSIKVLGFEVASMYADTDSVIFLIRVNKTAYVESMDRFTGASGLNMSDLQAILLGRPFVPSLGQLSAGNMDQVIIRETDGSEAIWSLQSTGAITADWMFRANITPEYSYLTSTNISVGNGNTANFIYTEQEPTDAGIIAAENTIAARVLGHNISAALTWNLGRAQWNRGITISKPKVPAAYSRITTEGLLRFLGQPIRQ